MLVLQILTLFSGKKIYQIQVWTGHRMGPHRVSQKTIKNSYFVNCHGILLGGYRITLHSWLMKHSMLGLWIMEKSRLTAAKQIMFHKEENSQFFHELWKYPLSLSDILLASFSGGSWKFKGALQRKLGTNWSGLHKNSNAWEGSGESGCGIS